MISDSLVVADPATPVFVAAKGMPVRIRMVHPGGLAEQTWVLDGHVWQEEPYVDGSTRIGVNPSSQWLGSRDGFGPNNQFDIVVAEAGGAAGVTGDYLYRSFIGNDYRAGLWGILRVGEENADVVTVTALAESEDGGFTMSGINSVNPVSQEMAPTVSIADSTGSTLGTAEVDPKTGRWSFEGDAPPAFPLRVTSAQNGQTVALNFIVMPTGREPVPRRVLEAVPQLKRQDQEEMSRFLPKAMTLQ
jgi:hypothetical protein